MKQLSFTGALEKDKDGTWWYVHVPKKIRQSLKHLEKWGMIPVIATIGKTNWEASLMPWADGSAQLVVNKNIRAKENLDQGEKVQVYIQPRN